MKKLYIAKNPIDANLFKGILEGEKIQAIVQGEFLWSVRGEVPITPETCPSVWIINDDDYERAVQILRDFELQGMSTDSIGDDWKCKKCGESNEKQFSECWQCGSEKNT